MQLCGHGKSSIKDDVVAVIGGGNTALENILTLTKYAREVIAVIVTHDFTGNPDLRERITKLPNVKTIRNTEVLEVIGSTMVTGIKLGDLNTDREWVEPVDGVFPSNRRHGQFPAFHRPC